MILKNLYPYGKKRALTMSYDDGSFNDRKLVEIFNRYGIKGTFHLNSGYLHTSNTVDIEEIPELYKGHEIACHSVTHPSLAGCPREEMVREVYEDRRALEAIAGYAVRGMSYPNGSISDEVVDVMRACGIVYSRTVNGTENFFLPSDFLRWHPTCHNKYKITERLPAFAANRYPLPCFYVWGHSYEYPRDDTWGMIEEFCREASKIEDCWFATNIEIYNYVQALKSLEFTVDCKTVRNMSALSVWVSVNNEPVEIKAGETLKV
nr:polysaccharide deacetylase family protein [Clostridia bacterium]